MNYFSNRRRVLLVGVLADKDYAALTKILNAAADEYICVTPNSDRPCLRRRWQSTCAGIKSP